MDEEMGGMCQSITLGSSYSVPTQSVTGNFNNPNDGIDPMLIDLALLASDTIEDVVISQTASDRTVGYSNIDQATSPSDQPAEGRIVPLTPTFMGIGVTHIASVINSSSLRPPLIPFEKLAITCEQLEAVGHTFPVDPPTHIIRYAVGCREMAMQTQFINPFDLVEPDPYAHPPYHTRETAQLRAWEKTMLRYPACQPKGRDKLGFPEVRIAFGPLGWDQVWGYICVDVRDLLDNATSESWWLTISEEPRTWCFAPARVEMHGLELSFPYGYDTVLSKKCPATGTNTTESLEIPANEPIIVSSGEAIVQWAKQVLFRNDHYLNGPPLTYRFTPNDPYDVPTITVRFQNIHPEAPEPTIHGGSRWIKSWLTNQEITLLSAPETMSYLDAVLDGGFKPDPTLSGTQNMINMLEFWGVERLCDGAAAWLCQQRWMLDRYCVNDWWKEQEMRHDIRECMRECVARLVRAIPF